MSWVFFMLPKCHNLFRHFIVLNLIHTEKTNKKPKQSKQKNLNKIKPSNNNKFFFGRMWLTRRGMAAFLALWEQIFCISIKKFWGIKMAHSFSFCSRFQNAVMVTPANQDLSSILPKKVFCSICGRIKSLININKWSIVKKMPTSGLYWI